MTGCIFCKIASGEIAARTVLEDDHVVAFHDMSPQAPVHVLVIPREHVATLADVSPGADGEVLLGRVLAGARRAAEDLGLPAGGYRTVINCGESAGQSVFHLHAHVLGGRSFAWPPG